MVRSTPVDGFSLAYDRPTPGAGLPVLLLHGWPGDRHDWREVVARLDGRADVVVPDLRGFGESDKHPRDPATAYDAAAQVRSLLGLLDELRIDSVVVAGYDVGSRVAQRLAADAPHRARALVVAPPVPGVGERVLEAEPQREYWYQPFHRLTLPDGLIDGRPDAVRAYLEHFWQHWSGPAYTPDPTELDRLTAHYGAPGAFLASIAWYRAGAGTVATSLAERPPARADRLRTPTTVLWPDQDRLFPRAWSDRLDEFFADVTLEWLDGAGHFSPLEAPDRFATAILAAAGA
jgi:pimeloyl-ACP methyl ester carboxylesterase